MRLKTSLDRSVLEIVANERAMLTARIYPTRQDSVEVGAFAHGESAQLQMMECWKMHNG